LDVFDAIRSRRSVRAFTREAVFDSEIEKLLDAARWAPSAGNIQPWEFIIVREPTIKKGLCKAALNQEFIEDAPVIIVVCANVKKSEQGYGLRGTNLYSLQDSAAATQNLLLAAQATGLAACWVGAFKEEKAAEVLNVPRGVRPVAIIPIGHAAEKPRPPTRRSTNEIIHHETFDRRMPE
jgi:nitroreductase